MEARWIEPKVRTSIGLSEVVEAEANESEQSNQLVETNKVNISTYSQASHRRKLADISVQFRWQNCLAKYPAMNNTCLSIVLTSKRPSFRGQPYR
jgi:hypothetical protein